MVDPSCWEGTLVLDLGNSWSETWYYHLLYYVINLRFYILYNILDIYAFTFSGVGVFAIQGRPTWFPLPPWRPDWWQRGIDGPGGERNVKLTTATTAYKNILQISCWLCNGCTITSQTLEATLTEWPFRWITLDIVVLWLHLFYFHQLLDEMVT